MKAYDRHPEVPSKGPLTLLVCISSISMLTCVISNNGRKGKVFVEGQEILVCPNYRAFYNS